MSLPCSKEIPEYHDLLMGHKKLSSRLNHSSRKLKRESETLKRVARKLRRRAAQAFEYVGFFESDKFFVFGEEAIYNVCSHYAGRLRDESCFLAELSESTADLQRDWQTIENAAVEILEASSSLVRITPSPGVPPTGWKRVKFDSTSTKTAPAGEPESQRPGVLVRDYKKETFHFFPQLPAELRTMIWAAAVHRPCTRYTTALSPLFWNRDLSRIAFDVSDGLWGACRESRYAVLRSYHEERDPCPRWEGDILQRKRIDEQLDRINDFQRGMISLDVQLHPMGGRLRSNLFGATTLLRENNISNDLVTKAIHSLYKDLEQVEVEPDQSDYSAGTPKITPAYLFSRGWNQDQHAIEYRFVEQLKRRQKRVRAALKEWASHRPS